MKPRLRQDLRSQRGPPAAPTTSPSPAPRRRRPSQIGIIVLVEAADGRLALPDRQLLGAARRSADLLGLAVLAPAWPGVAPQDLIEAGADIVQPVEAPSGACEREAMAQVLHDLPRGSPTLVICPDDPGRAGEAGRRLVARGAAPTLGQVVALEADRAIVRRAGRLFTSPLTPVMFLRPETFAPADAAGEGVILPTAVAAPGRLRIDGQLATPQSATPLPKAEFIVTAGLGVSDWPRFLALAVALEAVPGATRAVCDAGLLPRDRQIGASGHLVSPRGYLALGVSGAPHHLQGLRSCGWLVAVNTDPHAPIMGQADLAVVADAQAVMRALLAELGDPQ